MVFEKYKNADDSWEKIDYSCYYWRQWYFVGAWEQSLRRSAALAD